MTDYVDFELVKKFISQMNTEGERIKSQVAEARDALREALELDGLTDCMSDAWTQVEVAMTLVSNAKKGIDDFEHSEGVNNLSAALDELEYVVEALTGYV